MPQFTNQAQLSYNDVIVNSNVAVGELLAVLSITKTAVDDDYTPEGDLTYVVSIVNSGAVPLTGLTVTDDLGAYTFGGETVYPLAYTEGSIKAYINGVLQAVPTVEAGPPLTVSGLNVPAGGNLMLIYAAEVTRFASPEADGNIINVATLTGAAGTPLSASAEVSPEVGPRLTVTKTIEPAAVSGNGSLTYTFTIQNTGNAPAVATDDVVLSDTFSPILGDLVVTLDGVVLAEGADYTYDEAAGSFVTTAGRITVPAAEFTRDPETGLWITTPGSVQLVITGTV